MRLAVLDARDCASVDDAQATPSPATTTENENLDPSIFQMRVLQDFIDQLDEKRKALGR